MEIKFAEFENQISLDKIRALKFTIINNFKQQFLELLDFPAGARELSIIVGRSDMFESISDFVVHCISIQFANWTKFNFPNDYFSKAINIKEMNGSAFLSSVNHYLHEYFNDYYTNIRQ